MLFQKVHQLYVHLIDISRNLIIDQSQSTLQLKYRAELPPSFEQITALFTITGLLPKGSLKTNKCTHLPQNIQNVLTRTYNLPFIQPQKLNL